MARNIKANAAKRRRSNRVWSLLKSKFGSEKTIEPTIDDMGNYAPFVEEDAEDRYERHMKPIREAQQNGIVAKQSHTTQILQASARPVDEPKGL
jgi:hypothetical protein